MRKDCKASNGIYTFEMNNGIMTAVLSDLIIQYVKKNDISKSLNERAQAKVDPFNSMEIITQYLVSCSSLFIIFNDCFQTDLIMQRTHRASI